ncbi:Ribosomal RNA small subunit methyltransferase I [Geodia barretti]|uniref:Ribosomal RNA small subunit methyltransferase I n=1 Tax=Geodia barretti TaxID=519541 RepID=A0AA35R737_GEOBA|nr:Ribosomal RNA small subunit methyltransferase I [Geodia barretti]
MTTPADPTIKRSLVPYALYSHPWALYVIGTPIGNLGDLTLRASRILSSVPLVAAEDTRVTRRLLAHLDAHPRLLSCHEHNWKRQLPRLLEALDEGDVALATDAGSPAISDPGAGLVAAVAEAGHSVVTIPGVSAVTAALSVAGFPADQFQFLGFLPRRRSNRSTTLTDAARLGQTLVLFESPHRLRATLTDIADALNDPPIAVCRELTKLHEEIWRGNTSDALAYFAAPRGEFTVVIGPGHPRRTGSDRQPGRTAANGPPHTGGTPRRRQTRARRGGRGRRLYRPPAPRRLCPVG